MQNIKSTRIVRLEDLISYDMKISSPPTIFLLINETMNNPKSSILDIARIISNDQGLTARLLKMANSPLYGFPSKIETITQAISILGTQQINDLILATTVLNLFKKIPEELIDLESFWNHSIACGISARVIATYRREHNVERFFVAGILHDIGRLILYTKMPELSVEILETNRESKKLLYRIEQEITGYDHADVGGLLADKWKLPLSIKEMVKFHHRPALSTHFPTETAVIHLADILAHAMELGSSGERFVPPLDTNAWESVGLTPSLLSSVMKKIDEQFNETIKALRME
ncbi:MAG: HDOD domain-containing protein [Thermodesulfovibrionales bacterium]